MYLLIFYNFNNTPYKNIVGFAYTKSTCLKRYTVIKTHTDIIDLDSELYSNRFGNTLEIDMNNGYSHLIYQVANNSMLDTLSGILKKKVFINVELDID